MRLAGVRIGTDDAAGAIAAYATLLAVPGTSLRAGGMRFALGRGTVDVVPGPPGLHAVRFLHADGEPPLHDAHGIALTIDRDLPADDAPTTIAIDHVVVQTTAPERAIALWRDRMGLRLALDREFPARHLRLLFFRSGGITLEYASPLPAPDGPAGDDRLHGVSYRVTDLAARRERLLAAGVDVSPVRRGMREGTTVATVLSGTAGVPTLLLQVDA
jgi:catechol 2,3-dioxygenase-like lactoylglutathione lyase family enzyme